MRDMTEAEVRARRMEVQRQLSAQLAENIRIYTEVVKPVLAEAKTIPAGVKTTSVAGRRVADLQPMSMGQAELVDRSTPSGQLAWGRARMDQLDQSINKLRREQIALGKRLDEILRAKGVAQLMFVPLRDYSPMLRRAARELPL